MKQFLPDDDSAHSRPMPLPGFFLLPRASGADCEAVSRAIVAWFDGEASVEEERLARRHLEECLRCAAMWRDWSSARFLWRDVRTPAAPIGLLTRVLQAVRLHALLGQNNRSAGGEYSSFSQSTLQARAQISDAEISAPSDLAEAILRSTTRRAEIPQSTLTAFDAEMANAAISDSMAWTETYRIASGDEALAGKTARRGRFLARTRLIATAAVPALSMWIIAIASHPDISPSLSTTLPLTQSVVNARGAVVKIASNRSAATVAESNIPKPSVSAAGRAQAAAKIPSAPLAVPRVNAAVTASSSVTSFATFGIADLKDTSHEVSVPVRAAAWGSVKATSDAQAPAVQLVSAVSYSMPRSASRPSSALPVANRRSGMVRNASRAIISRWSGHDDAHDGSPIGAMRVAASVSDNENGATAVPVAFASTSVAATAEASSASPSRALANRDAEGNEVARMHATLEEMQGSSDSRPEPVRSVVDAYAAALLAENGDGNEAASISDGHSLDG